MKRRFGICTCIAILAVALLTVGSSAWAKDMSPAEFYKNNPLTMYIGYSAGGGTDYVARLFAKYWSEVSGGKVIPKNMGGAGGIMAANYVNAQKPDGLSMVFGMLSSTFIMPAVNKNKAAKFDPLAMNYIIGGMHEPFVVHISAKKPYETLADLKKVKGLKFSAVTPYGGDTAAIIPYLHFNKLDVKLITGYKGGSASLLATAKGETDMVVAPASTGLRAVNKGFVKMAVAVMDYERCSIYPDAPAMPELMKFTPEQEKIFKTCHQAGYILRTGAVAPGVSAERVAYLRDKFYEITKLKEFQEEANSKFPLGPTPASGVEIQARVKESVKMDFDKVRGIIKQYLALK